MSTEDHDGAVRSLGDVFDELHAPISKSIDDVAVMNDLVVDAKGFSRADLKQLVHDINGHVDAGTEAPGIGKDQFHASNHTLVEGFVG